MKIGICAKVTPTTDAPYGAVVTYTLIVSNTGTIVDTALLTDTLPTQVGFRAWVENHGATVVNNEIRWRGTITASTALTFTFTASYTFGIGLPITNTAIFSGSLQAGSDQASFMLKRYTLRTVKTGTGDGLVTSTPAGISCGRGGGCSGSFADGAAITLTAAPQNGAPFMGWTGACTGAGLSCTFTIRADSNVTANFR